MRDVGGQVGERRPDPDQAIWDAYIGLMLNHDMERISKVLVRYELSKNSLDVPGDIVECGVLKGDAELG